MHLGAEYAEGKDGFKCVSKKNIVPRGPKLKWLATMDPHKLPTSDLAQYWDMAWELPIHGVTGSIFQFPLFPFIDWPAPLNE